MKSTIHLSILLLLSLLGFSLGADSASPALQDTCSKEFEKLTMCLDYATGKAAEPGTTCCTAVTGIRKEEPACLCYIIQQAHSSSSGMAASMGIKFDRLTSLADSCKLANSSVSNCPKLLNLSPNSPDAAIFTDPKSANGTAKSSNSTSSTSPTATLSPVITTNGTGTGRLHSSISIAISMAAAIFFSFF